MTLVSTAAASIESTVGGRRDGRRTRARHRSERGLRAARREAPARPHTGRTSSSSSARKPPWRLLLEQFTNAMIVVLLVAGGRHRRSSATSRTRSSSWRSSSSTGSSASSRSTAPSRRMDALKRMTSPTARVVRDGETRRSSRRRSSCPGDLVRLDAGDIVTADLRLLEAPALRINEAALTGESEPAEKIDRAAARRARRRSSPTSATWPSTGTAVTYGRGAGVVVATGMATALGRVAELLQEHAGGQTPLQRRLVDARQGAGRRSPSSSAPSCSSPASRGASRRTTMFLDRGQPRRRGDPRGAAGGRDRRARPRRPAHGPPARARPQAARRRDARLGHRHLLRQDRAR